MEQVKAIWLELKEAQEKRDSVIRRLYELQEDTRAQLQKLEAANKAVENLSVMLGESFTKENSK